MENNGRNIRFLEYWFFINRYYFLKITAHSGWSTKEHWSLTNSFRKYRGLFFSWYILRVNEGIFQKCIFHIDGISEQKVWKHHQWHRKFLFPNHVFKVILMKTMPSKNNYTRNSSHGVFYWNLDICVFLYYFIFFPYQCMVQTNVNLWSD